MKGLSDLQREGIVRIKPRIRGLQYRDRVVVDGGILMRLNRPYPWSPICRIKDLESGVVTKIAIDLQDWPNWFSRHALTQADIVFKRSYDKNTAGLIAREFGVKVLPFGMSHSSKLDGNVLSDGQLRILSLLGKLESVLNDPLRLRGRLSTIRFHGHRPMAQINSKSFTDRKPSLPDRYVFFQVKYYDWNNRWSTPLNEYRAEIIRSLRQHLGNSFQGGMFFEGSVPDGYRDCITDLPTSQEHYLNLVQRATVVVSTNGFAQSPPWKLCEYLKMGKCIVSEPMAYELPVSLVDGRDVQYFQTPDDCAAVCQSLLDNPRQTEELGGNARSFYEANIKPRNTILRTISNSLEARS
ncbi:MAG: glycosyltransferase family 1 protein [Bacteroidetes bacterium]|nr:glycosyltransferase family 1 protein [Bacteroidota bacterium]MCW5897447.1 glycosyltransferase family 1 protein [Bacteroidota bacterium]